MLSRRQFLSATVGGAGLVLRGSLARAAQAPRAAYSSKPNVLFIAIDDLNDWTGCLGGHPDVKTPHIDRLAARGVLFQNAFCTAPACNPSRASLMTGILPSTSGVYHNNQPWRPVPLMQRAVTLEQHFRACGYHVLGRGKIYHGGTSGGYFDPKGWHEYIPKGRDPVPPKRPVNGIPNTAHFDWGPVDVGDEEMDDHKVSQWISGKLRQRYDQPFFMACGFFRPHLPWYVPRKYFGMYPEDKVTLPEVNENDLDDVPELGRRMARPEGDHRKVLEHQQWRKAVQGYLASISFVDTCVGRVVDALDRSPHAKNTVIVLWGDHGWHLGEKLHWRKFALWEEATHAPLLLVAPGVTKPEGKCPRTVSFADIYPTLCDLCGLPKPEQLEGASLLPLLQDPEAPWDRPALTTHGRNNHTVRSERWRYIRYRDGSEELYDRDKDPLEWTNLAGNREHADVKKQLARRLPEVNAPDAPGGGGRRRGKRGEQKQAGLRAGEHPFQVKRFGPPEPIRSFLV